MEDITHLMNDYRECVRHIWNNYFALKGGSNNPELIKRAQENERFEYDIATLLFESLVLYKIGRRQYALGKLLPFIKISTTGSGCPIMVAADNPPKGRWDHPVEIFVPAEMELSFIDFFDWDQFSYRDWKHYLVQITQSAKYPELIGHQALLDWEHVKVLFDPDLIPKDGECYRSAPIAFTRQ
jgi:hypothetical protein